MERIDSFDNYIRGSLSEKDKADFENHLDKDSVFAEEFKVYLLAVRGICQEAMQDDIEFGHAMKSLTKAELQSIIGKKEKPRAGRPDMFRQRILWISSMVAMLIVAVAIGWNYYTYYTASQDQLLTAENRICDAETRICDIVYGYAYIPLEGDRGDEKEYVNLNELTDQEIEARIPEMRKAFDEDETDSQDWHIDGKTLAMAYLKLHRKNDALVVLRIMAEKSSDPQPYNRLIEQLE